MPAIVQRQAATRTTNVTDTNTKKIRFQRSDDWGKTID